jgi:SNF2 family DNA or RNA helicase
LQKRATPALSQKIQELLELGYEVKRFRKAQACLEILQQFPGKFLIFTEFKATVHFLVHFFQQAGYHALPFTGDLNPFQRMETIQQFKTKADLLISTNSGGEGLNIQFASRLINYDLPWNPMIVEQRIGRIHRLGQENEVFIFNLSVYETIEAKILELLTHKIRIFQIAIGELDLILGTLHPEKSFEELVKTYWLDSLKSPSSNELPRSWKELESTLESASEEYQKIKKNEALLSVLLETPSSPTGKE